MRNTMLSRVRACLLAAAVAVAGQSWALGLGEIELDSALNERLVAEIELLDAGTLQPTEILVSLASREDFERVGVERFFYLTDLRFEVAEGARGKIIKVTSSQPISEPYLNFIVEVYWPSGRLLREYTLLLDPPTYGETVAAPVTPPAPEPAPVTAGTVERPAEPAPERVTEQSSGTRVDLARATQREPMPVGEDEYRMTGRNDTLWKIAIDTLPAKDITVKQNMLALQRKNPRAFIRNNINLLKAGYVLRLADAEEARLLTAQAAANEVHQQSEDWRAGVTREPPQRIVETPSGLDESEDAVLRSQVDATPAPQREQQQEEAEGQLRIVAGEGDSARGSEVSADTQANLADALEGLGRLQRRVDEVEVEAAREQELSMRQIEVKDRQLELRDRQIAELQEQLAETRDQLEEMQQNQNQSAPAQGEPWWSSPYTLGALLVTLVLILVVVLFKSRRREPDEGYLPEAAVMPVIDDDADTPALAQEEEDDPEPTVVLPLDVDEDEEELHSFSAEPENETRSETGNVTGEADIYIAYGRYAQAVNLLNGVLAEDPERYDVRLKLLETFIDTQDRDAFDAQMAELVARCDEEEVLFSARELEGRFGDSETQSNEVTDDPETASVQQGATVTPINELVLASQDTGGQPQPFEEHDVEDEPADMLDVSGQAADADDEFDFELELGDFGEDLSDVAGTQEETEERSVGPWLDFDDGDQDFSFDDAKDSAATKLDLARAYIDMNDSEGAREILAEVLGEGNDQQQSAARDLLDGISD